MERVGKASPSVSIFSRAPLCPNTCRHCRCKPCDIATDHDDHICYNCEERQLFPERIPKWETPSLPICDSWCQECATQRCCTRGTHEYHRGPINRGTNFKQEYGPETGLTAAHQILRHLHKDLAPISGTLQGRDQFPG